VGWKRSPRPGAYLNILIRHPNVVRICLQILRSGHHCELDCPLVAEGFVGPFPHGSDLLDRGNTVVRDENLWEAESVTPNPELTAPPYTYRGDDRVAISILDKVLDLAGRGFAESVATDEM
jgi:hypothetical protein